jgi:ribose transport system permease protein
MTNTVKKKSFISVIKNSRALALLIVIAILYLIISLILPETFGTWENFTTILLNMSAEVMILIAMTLLLISGEIDLSLGSIMVLGAIFCGMLMIRYKAPMWLAILAPLAMSLLLGLLNGVIVAKLQVTSFIATLATGMIYLGIAIKLAGTGWTNFPDPMFQMLGQARLLTLQLPVYYMIIAVAVSAFLLARTRYFRQYYYIGGNQKAASLTGINISRTKIVAYMLAALLSCVAGLISAMRFNSAIPSVGAGVEMRAVTAAVVGGVSFTGGSGTVLGAAVGALFIAVLNNALTAVKVSPDLQNCITGVVLILAIVIDIAVSKKKS